MTEPQFPQGRTRKARWCQSVQWVALQERDAKLRELESFVTSNKLPGICHRERLYFLLCLTVNKSTLFAPERNTISIFPVVHCTNILEKTRTKAVSVFAICVEMQDLENCLLRIIWSVLYSLIRSLWQPLNSYLYNFISLTSLCTSFFKLPIIFVIFIDCTVYQLHDPA